MTQGIGAQLEALRSWITSTLTRRGKEKGLVYPPGMKPVYMLSIGFIPRPSWGDRSFHPCLLIVSVGGLTQTADFGSVPYEQVDYVNMADDYVSVLRESRRERFMQAMRTYWDTHGAEEIVRHLHRYETDPGTGRRGGTS